MKTWHELLWLPRVQGGPWPAPVAIAPDGSLLAFAPSINSVQLLDLKALRDVARLSTPHTQNVNALRFSLDSGSLAVGRDNTVINVWDLRRVRRQLDRLGLDWNLPAIAPPAPTAFYTLTKVEVHRGNIVPLAVYVSPSPRIDELTQKLHESPGDVAALIERGRLLASVNHLDQAEVDCETALRLQPGNVEALAWLTIIATRGQRPQQADAWFSPLLATPVGSRSDLLADSCYTVAFQILASQELDSRSIDLACQAAQRAVDLTAAAPSADDRSGKLARYLFQLAAARARAGQLELARAAYDRAVRWCEEPVNSPVSSRLLPDRRAAAQALGIDANPERREP